MQIEKARLEMLAVGKMMSISGLFEKSYKCRVVGRELLTWIHEIEEVLHKNGK